ncbi:Ras GTPase-activating protein gap-2, putative [Entamoeba invadens IP1]|uniref:Ras GTPase-activating protein gap-2, putative n=1 Tax=Entamoeba invadens IP1 TaxID=370355 RepID=UPI0002C3D811|nr:Ras GTPase-activating protein gap-2, putative [Entamoeba invadens IP1]ELP85448.1 Ras GTPase-activating protein gap-2, putative [Entamoeba invadens IP1]|eukprot:XP_004184794.1 Ras GTPase-activating protein gap-2, putative [Entamoeba invadens IP1]
MSKPSLAELIAMQKAGTLPKQYTEKPKFQYGVDMSNGTKGTQQPTPPQPSPPQQQPRQEQGSQLAMMNTIETPRDTPQPTPQVQQPVQQQAQPVPQQQSEPQQSAPAPKKPTLAELIAMQKAGNLPKQFTQKEKIPYGVDLSNGVPKSTPVEPQNAEHKPSLTELLAMQKAGKLPDEFQKRGGAAERPVEQKESFIHREVTPMEAEVAKWTNSRVSAVKEENLYYSERELGVMQNMFEFFMKKAPQILTTMFSNRDKAEELADAVLNLTYGKRLAMDFVSMMLKEEFATHKEAQSLFRENTSATRVAKSFLGKVGRKYLLDTYKKFVLDIIHSGVSFEIDDHRETDPEKLKANKEALFAACRKLFDTVINSFDLLPPGVKLLARVFNEYAAQYFGELSDDARNNLTGSFIMLRYVNPAIFSPEKYGIVDDPKDISMGGRRNLILLSKVLQNLSNGVRFIQEKEPYMMPLNALLDEYLDKFKKYFRKIVNVAKNFPFVLVVEDTAITDMKPIALLHKELCERADEIVGTSENEISQEFCKYMVSLGNYGDKTGSAVDFRAEMQIGLKKFLVENKYEAVYASIYTMKENNNKTDYILVVTLYTILILTTDYSIVDEIHCFDIKTVNSMMKTSVVITKKDGKKIEGETMHGDGIIVAMLRAFKSCYNEGVYDFTVELPPHRKAIIENVFSLQSFNKCGGFSGIYYGNCTYDKVPINESVEAFIESSKDDEKSKELLCNMFNTMDPNNKSDSLSSKEFQPVLRALKCNKFFTKLKVEQTPLNQCKDALKEVFEQNETLESVSLRDVQINSEWEELLDIYLQKNKIHRIKEIDLANNKIDGNALRILAKIISTFQVESVNLSGSVSSEKSVSAFFQEFEEIANQKKRLPLEKIDLTGAKFGADAMEFMVTKFSQVFPNIKELILADATVPKGATLIPVLNYLNFLNVVDLSGLEISKKAECDLPKLLLPLNSLKELHLRKSVIPGNVMKDVLLNIKGTGVALDLQAMDMDEECVNTLSETIKLLKSIVSLDISKTSIKDKGLSKILEGLVDNTVIETLNISNIYTGDDTDSVMNSLTKYLKKTTSLKHLTLVGGSKTEQQFGLNMIPILNALVKNDNIVFLDIQSQGMGNKGAFALANLLKITKTLQTLKWDENQTGIFGIHAIVDSMRVNTSVKELQLPILDCRALQVQGKFGNGKIIGELVKTVQKKSDS